MHDTPSAVAAIVAREAVLGVAVLALVVGPIGTAVFVLGFVQGDSPCILCWAQRTAMVLVAVTGPVHPALRRAPAVHRPRDAHRHLGRVHGHPPLGAAPGARHRAGVQPVDSRRTHLHLVVLHLLDDARARRRARDGAGRRRAPARAPRAQAARAHRPVGCCSSSSRQTQRRRLRAPDRRRTWANPIPCGSPGIRSTGCGRWRNGARRRLAGGGDSRSRGPTRQA